MDIHVDVNPLRVDYQQMRALLALSGWGTEDCYTDAVLGKMINNCAYFVVAHETNNLLGYARTFTDDIAVTWIAEILVHPEHRRQGVGAHIMKEVLRVSSHTAIYAEALVETEGFLESFGIKKQPRLVAYSRKWLTEPPTISQTVP